MTSAGYRFREYVTRHRVGVGAALIVAFSLVGGTVAAVTQASRATRQAELATGKHAEAAALFGLVVSHHELGQFEEAEAVFARALALFDTATMRPHPLAAEALLNIAMIRRLRSQIYDAEPLAASAVAMRGALYDPDHPDVIEALGEWGVALRDVGRYEESERVLHEALERANRSLGYDHQFTLTMRERWGTVLYHLGRYQEAGATVDSSIAVKRERLEPTDANYIMALSRAGDPYWMDNRLDRAEDRYRRALEGAGHSGIYSILVLDRLANIASARGDLDEADQLYDESLALAAEKLRPGHRYTQTVRVDQAHLRIAQGRGAEMVDTLLNVLEIRGQVFREPHPAIGRALHPLGSAYLAAGDAARAERVLLRALESYAEIPDTHWRVGDVESLLGAALVAQDRRVDGMRLLREGHATVVAHVGPESWQARATSARLSAAGG